MSACSDLGIIPVVKALQEPDDASGENEMMPSYIWRTWSQRNLRYLVIGDSSPADLDQLAKLFKTE